MCQCAIYAQGLCKIVLISPIHNICARFPQECTYSPMRNIYVQDCTYFPNAQYMPKICTRLYLFLQCAIYAQDLCKIVLLSPMHNYAQDLHKIVIISPKRNTCTRFAQDCNSFSNAHICARLEQDCTSLPNVQRLQALLEEICHISHICSKFRTVFTS